mmetsp:Transcript_18910/g.26058  ORF Transcript_18910/g.26058 Transcript_18910/m.26058 type:complete len:209 (+) Transcript_18910:2277-2903(+)
MASSLSPSEPPPPHCRSWGSPSSARRGSKSCGMRCTSDRRLAAHTGWSGRKNCRKKSSARPASAMVTHCEPMRNSTRSRGRQAEGSQEPKGPATSSPPEGQLALAWRSVMRISRPSGHSLGRNRKLPSDSSLALSGRRGSSSTRPCTSRSLRRVMASLISSVRSKEPSEDSAWKNSGEACSSGRVMSLKGLRAGSLLAASSSRYQAIE